MTLSQPFLQSEIPTRQEQHLLCLMGVFLPPVPFFVLTGPNYTIKTKEFAISTLLTVVPRFLLFSKDFFSMILVFLLFWAILVSYSIWFIYIGLDKGRSVSRGYVAGDLEVGTGEDDHLEVDIADSEPQAQNP